MNSIWFLDSLIGLTLHKVVTPKLCLLVYNPMKTGSIYHQQKLSEIGVINAPTEPYRGRGHHLPWHLRGSFQKLPRSDPQSEWPLELLRVSLIAWEVFRESPWEKPWENQDFPDKNGWNWVVHDDFPYTNGKNPWEKPRISSFHKQKNGILHGFHMDLTYQNEGLNQWKWWPKQAYRR